MRRKVKRGENRKSQKKHAEKEEIGEKKPAMVCPICRLSYSIEYLSKKERGKVQTPFANIQITIPF